MKSGTAPGYDLVQQHEQPAPDPEHRHQHPVNAAVDRVTLRVALVIALMACVFSIVTISVVVYYTPS